MTPTPLLELQTHQLTCPFSCSVMDNAASERKSGCRVISLSQKPDKLSAQFWAVNDTEIDFLLIKSPEHTSVVKLQLYDMI